MDSCLQLPPQTGPDYGQGMNPISRLAQIQQAKKEKEPEYVLLSERGMPRRREFIMQVNNPIVFVFSTIFFLSVKFNLIFFNPCVRYKKQFPHHDFCLLFVFCFFIIICFYFSELTPVVQAT